VQPDRVVLLDPSGAKHLVVLDREVVTVPAVGVVRADTLRGLVGRRWTKGRRTFLVLIPSIRDDVELLRRQAQIIGPKDAPVLVWNCDLKGGDFVVEVGAGSGAMTLALAHAVGPKGRVVTYDMRPDFLDQARRNVAAAGLESAVEFKIGDARAGIVERGADAVLLDMPDPWEAVDSAAEALRPCGHFASYSPNMEQVNRTVKALRAGTFVEIRSVEIIEREIVAHEAGTHPSFAPLGHTGYLTFARKVLDTF
jgi:tRNA (adenine57-N1/adenine58-N1)-methyltransferase